MNIEYKHGLGKDEAKTRLNALGEYLGNKHGIKVSWDSDDRASFNGKYMVVTIQGELVLGDDKVNFTGKDPGMLWRKKAKSYIEDKLAQYLDPNTPADQLPRS
jgi:hypothetical protein